MTTTSMYTDGKSSEENKMNIDIHNIKTISIGKVHKVSDEQPLGYSVHMQIIDEKGNKERLTLLSDIKENLTIKRVNTMFL